MKLLKDKANLICISILTIICILMFFINMGGYPYIDVDETKFAIIAKDMLNRGDWINIKLSGKNIFDLSPLYFWLINLCCIIFGKISPEMVRLPISLSALAGILALYTTIKSRLSKIYALIISIIFATSLGILVFSRLATNDMLFVVLSMASVLFGYSSILSKKYKEKRLFWVYFFSALAVLTGGLFGIIPLIAVIGMHVFSGDLKNLIKPKSFLAGIITFFLLISAWQILMICNFGLEYIKGFFSGYSLFKYAGINKTAEMLCLFVLGFSPWIFSFLWILGYRFKDIVNSVISYFKDDSQDKLKEKWKKLKITEKFISLNTIVFFIGLFFALIWGAKYTFLILFLIFPASCISGHYWYEYIVKAKHRKSIFFATIIPDLILIICSLIGLFGHNVLNQWLFQGLNHLLIPLIIIFFAIPIIGIFSVILKGKKTSFIANIILMVSLSFVITPNIFNFISLNSGENDLITFASTAREEQAELTAFIPSRKYSLEYYYDKPVTFFNEFDVKQLKEYLRKNPETYVVVEIKDMFTIEENDIGYMLVDSGTRYCLIKYSETTQYSPEGSENA